MFLIFCHKGGVICISEVIDNKPFSYQEIERIKEDLRGYLEDPEKYIRTFKGVTLLYDLTWKDVMYILGQTLTLGSKTQVLGKVVAYGDKFGEGNGNPLQRSCLENPRDEGAWWAAVYGVTQNRARLKQLSSSSSSMEINGLVMNQ